LSDGGDTRGTVNGDTGMGMGQMGWMGNKNEW
jgi:hypothetical protein